MLVNTSVPLFLAVWKLIQQPHGRLRLGAEGLEQPWKVKFNKRSHRYSTHWDELLEVA